jgi:hypothetical protein
MLKSILTLTLMSSLFGAAIVTQAKLSDALPTKPVFYTGDLPKVPAGAFLFSEDFEQDKRYARNWRITNPKCITRLQASTCGGLYTMALLYTKGESKRETGYLSCVQPIDLRKAKKPLFKYDIRGVITPKNAATITAEVSLDNKLFKPFETQALAQYPLMRSRGGYLKAGRIYYIRFKAQIQFDAMTRSDDKGLLLDDVQVIETGQ